MFLQPHARVQNAAILTGRDSHFYIDEIFLLSAYYGITPNFNRQLFAGNQLAPKIRYTT